ncbi:Mediator of RNA polymerase II transcription subunit 13 [Phlyctema vagabunda]|uniref:Mediator of RNA polymerase II transcription subunit 13 n=1 Tax=Phlyctema vagabunda TaxID=108571 RepID=A0ABR4PFH9_9HELO
MELGEYATNVLSNSNFASIHYEYYTLQNPTSAEAGGHMRKVEVLWRKDGALVYCDTSRGGIWRFRNTAAIEETRPSTTQELVELQGRVLSLKDQGVYEPSSLTRGKGNTTASNLSASSSTSSPSSSLENAIRNSQSINARAVQASSQEPQPSSSPSTKVEPNPAESILHFKWIHEQFISAVLSSLVYFLCRDHGFLPLNARTLILNLAEANADMNLADRVPSMLKSTTLVTLDISLTSLGTLVIKAHCDTVSGLQRLQKHPDKSSQPTDTHASDLLWLAPGGHAAKYYGDPDESHLARLDLSCLPLSPTNCSQFNVYGASLKSWKTACLDWLASKGLNTRSLENGGWTTVRILKENTHPNSHPQDLPVLEDRSILPWPTNLCFRNSRPGSNGLHSSSHVSGNYDPLTFAEEWFMTKEERNIIILKRQKEKQRAEAVSREQADVESRNMAVSNLSPAALRRGSNTGAIYPTPPDAVQQPVGATPSFDGNVSTPGQQAQLFSNDAEITGIVMSSTDQDNTGWVSGDLRHTSSKPNVHFTDQDNDNDNDNLFGDIGGDLFGDTDITDADFSFFDEPNAVSSNQSQITMESLNERKKSQDETSRAPISSKQIPDIKRAESEMPDMQENSQPKIKASDPVQTSPIASAIKPLVEERPNDIFKAPAVPVPRVTPPFTKESVFKLLFENSPNDQAKRRKLSISPAKASAFNKIDFDPPSVTLNNKYSANGRFNYAGRKSLAHAESLVLPKTKYLERRQKPKANACELSLLPLIFGQGEGEILDEDEFDDSSLADDSEGTDSSDHDDTSISFENSVLVLKPGAKRKRGDNAESSDTVAILKNGTDLDPPIATPVSSTGSLPPILGMDPADWSLTPFITAQYPEVQPTILSDAEFMATAQILADQAVSSTLPQPKFSKRGGNADEHKYPIMRQIMQNLDQAVHSFIDSITKCTVRSFLDIQGIPVLSQALRLPPRPMPHPRGPNSHDPTRPSNLFPLQIPRLEVRRSDTNLTILPSAISFWDNLGLGPSPGAKDISAVCIYPAMDGVLERASIFLDEISTAYESSRFGAHEKISTKEQPQGLLPLPIDYQQTSQIYALQVVKDAMAQLSKVLIACTTAQEVNLVVYCIYPPDDAALLVHICSSFEHLFNLYRRGLVEKKSLVNTELVLQLIPLDFVASPTSLKVPKPTDYAQLAMEVYDRCMDFSTSSSVPAILLERPLPKGIDFKLNANPSPSLLQENSCLHIAYAQSTDDRWITAAWTDNRGSQQMTASYCLGRKNEPISLPFSEIAHEIWETTLGILSHKKIHWRLMIAKVGVMTLSEIEFWTGLASTESSAHVNLTLIAVNTDPSLQLIPEAIKMPPLASATQSVLTPVSTPQASSILSPDNPTTPLRESVGNPATPNEPLEPDSDARLIDLTDQSWGAVASHRLNNSNSLLDFNPALISGYLIKRSGTRTSDAPIVLEVNLMHSDIVLGNPRTFHEGLLREIISYYRGLATIARVRGVVDGVKDGRPWHIAAAEKAVAALYMLM